MSGVLLSRRREAAIVTPLTLVLVMVGAGVGAACRWSLDLAIQTRHDSVFPWGTFAINVLGSLILGVILGAAAAGAESAHALALGGTGFCGGFTTFSTFGLETVRLAEEGSTFEATLNVLFSLGVGLMAATLGWYLALGVWS
jgi:fluoride exporter